MKEITEHTKKMVELVMCGLTKEQLCDETLAKFTRKHIDGEITDLAYAAMEIGIALIKATSNPNVAAGADLLMADKMILVLLKFSANLEAYQKHGK